MSIAFDAALIIAAIEMVFLLVRAPGARRASSTALLALGACGAAAAVSVPIALLVAVPVPSRRWVQRAGSAWLGLSVVVVALVAYLQRAMVRTLATDYGWLRVSCLFGLAYVICSLPAACLLHRDTQRWRYARYVIAALLIALVAGQMSLGTHVFVRTEPLLHGFLGVAGAACIVLLRSLILVSRRPPLVATTVLALSVAVAVPAIHATHAVRAYAAHQGLLLSDLMHVVHQETSPMPPIPARSVAAPPGSALSSRPRLVLLVTVDAMRADAARAPQLPTIAALRARSVEFTNTRSVAGYTLAALYGVLTGQGPWRITWKRMGSAAVPDMTRVPTLAGILAEHGYATATCGVMKAQRPKFPLTTGFAKIDSAIEKERNQDARGITADLVPACVERILAESDGRPLFLWLHFFDPHGPYHVHEGFAVDDSDELDRYRGEVRFVDHHLGRVFEVIEKRIAREDMLVVATADHGEEFGEHGGDFHLFTLYDEILRVPLFISAPGIAPASVDTPVSLVDLVPTVLALLQIPAPAGDGISLVPAMHGESLVSRPLFAETLRRGRNQRVIVDGGYKLIYNSRFHTYELFDLARDPGEQQSLADDLPGMVEELAAKMGIPAPR